ncbi:MAG: histidine phosphatase family protein [bacterium]|nr:histidine phosphatase family protein [bacterium]
MARLLLLRHGQSVWNAAHRWQGQADPPLSELGRQQATAAAARLEPTDLVAASTLRRSRASAEIIAEAMGCDAPIPVPELIERDVREFSGLTREQIEARFPGFLEDGRRPPGWEPDDVFLARILAGLNRLAELAGNRSAVVVTHGGVIYALEAHLGCPASRVANMSGRWVMVSSGQLIAGERVHPLENASRRWQGQADPPRSELRRQGVDIQTPATS